MEQTAAKHDWLCYYYYFAFVNSLTWICWAPLLISDTCFWVISEAAQSIEFWEPSGIFFDILASSSTIYCYLIASDFNNFSFASNFFMASNFPPSFSYSLIALQLFRSFALLYNSTNFFWILSNNRISLLKLFWESLWFINSKTSFSSVYSSSSSPLKPR